MTNPITRASITKKEAENELLETSKIVLPIQKQVQITNLIDTSTQVNDPRYVSKPVPDLKRLQTFRKAPHPFALSRLSCSMI